MTELGLGSRAPVNMAADLAANTDVTRILTRLTADCVALLGIAGSGAMIMSPSGQLRLAASSSDAIRIVELFGLQAEEGPGLEAFSTGEAVDHEIFRSQGGRWRHFSPVALKAHFRSASALPLRANDRTIGALSLFSGGTPRLQKKELLIARSFADFAAIGIAQRRAAADAQMVNEQLTQALTSRIAIEQAKGLVSARANVEVSTAFNRIRDYARSHNLPLVDVAHAVVEGTIDPCVLAPFVRRHPGGDG